MRPVFGRVATEPKDPYALDVTRAAYGLFHNGEKQHWRTAIILTVPA
jgi:hypothetical protein